ncbi:universal stress protein [Bizionia paragorgiae]|uniref:Nucleotide-binding universal stress protein, UspA family n=1 Tax=Bizionia paragorgiae TaxID=283786 RepID=A0A1H4BTA6_BIZPA|nr:universal stress protein [Bizionia paragorgiae]MDX1271697.1 universal stress protein [Bizionia paragorgiae]SEA51405.1 Nucleotide-binding universal stress protein, UspA family [Bizionia paragorgiae]
MKKILVPTDFSPEAENALKVAAQLAKKHNIELSILHIIDLPLQQISELGTPTDLPEAVYFMKLAQKKFEDLLAKDYLQSLTISHSVDFNEISQGILDACKNNSIDLIIMGSHGADGFKEMFIGSTAEKIVRTSIVPVLVIKNKHDDFNIEDFVFASDFKNDNKDTYKQAIKLAELFDARMHLLMVNTMSNFTTTATAKVRIHEFIEGNTFTNYTTNIYNDESVEKGILNFSEIINADLIGISTHGRQGISHFLSGSISEDLVNHANRPVITFKI